MRSGSLPVFRVANPVVNFAKIVGEYRLRKWKLSRLLLYSDFIKYFLQNRFCIVKYRSF